MHISKIGCGTGTVRIDIPQLMKSGRRPIDIFPSGINHPAVRKNRRGVFHISARGKLPQVGPVSLAPEQDRHGRKPAKDISLTSRGAEHNVSIGQVAWLNVIPGTERDLPQARPVDIYLIKIVVVSSALAIREQHLPGVITDSRIAKGTLVISDQRPDLARRGGKNRKSATIFAMHPVIFIAAIVTKICVIMSRIVPAHSPFGKEDLTTEIKILKIGWLQWCRSRISSGKKQTGLNKYNTEQDKAANPATDSATSEFTVMRSVSQIHLLDFMTRKVPDHIIIRVSILLYFQRYNP